MTVPCAFDGCADPKRAGTAKVRISEGSNLPRDEWPSKEKMRHGWHEGGGGIRRHEGCRKEGPESNHFTAKKGRLPQED